MTALGDGPAKADIKALGIDGLAEVMRDLDEPGYRVRQIVRWLYARGVRSFDEMTDLPSALRSRLAETYALGTLRLADRADSSDGTRKYLWELSDGVTVESVGLPASGRLTVCFSAQAGCGMGCAFCATGLAGFTRNLTPGEIVDQVVEVERDFGERASNAVAMGQGEPFANYDGTLRALRILNSPDGAGIGARHLTVSTCGLLDGIRRFSSEPEQFTLAVSLHSAVQETRDRIMPGVRRASLQQLRDALAHYAEATSRRPTLEYALLDGVNDTDTELAELVRFCRGLLVHVNLIPANPVAGTMFARSRSGKAAHFAKALAAAGVEATVRAERGADIDAACGQLRQRRATGAAGA